MTSLMGGFDKIKMQTDVGISTGVAQNMGWYSQVIF